MKRTPCVHILILIAFLVNSVGAIPTVQAQEFKLPAPGVMVRVSPPLNPPILKGIKVHPDDPFHFDFILDKGDSFQKPISSPNKSIMSSPNVSVGDPQQEQLKLESTKLIKYFLASLTIPEKDLWVNLSPYEKDRIIPQSFGLTEMGRDLLAEDYMLKQITASLIYPEGETGKKFWKRIYAEAQKKFGTTDIPVNTFNKVWIVPAKAVVYENPKAGTAYVVEAKLKVMLEQDYLSLQKHQSQPGDMFPAKRGMCPQAGCEQLRVSGMRTQANEPLNVKAPQVNPRMTNELASQIVREIIIPELTKEVNEGKNFAQLRQVYNSLILATWYKKKIKDSILEQVYADKNKIKGLSYLNNKNMSSPNAFGPQTGHSQLFVGDPQHIYQQYLKAFKKGVFNYIKDTETPNGVSVPRKYFSGGWGATHLGYDIDIETNSAMLGGDLDKPKANLSDIDLELNVSPVTSAPVPRNEESNKAMLNLPQREMQRLSNFLAYDNVERVYDGKSIRVQMSQEARHLLVKIHMEDHKTNYKEDEHQTIEPVSVEGLFARKDLRKQDSNISYILPRPLTLDEQEELVFKVNPEHEISFIHLMNNQMLITFGDERSVNDVLFLFLLLDEKIKVRYSVHNHPFEGMVDRYVSNYGGYNFKLSQNVAAMPSRPDLVHSFERGNVIFNPYGVVVYRVHPQLLTQRRKYLALRKGFHSAHLSGPLIGQWDKFVSNYFTNDIAREIFKKGNISDQELVQIYERYGIFIEIMPRKEIQGKDFRAIVEQADNAIDQRIQDFNFESVKDNLRHAEYIADPELKNRFIVRKTLTEQRLSLIKKGLLADESDILENQKVIKYYDQQIKFLEDIVDPNWKAERVRELNIWLQEGEKVKDFLGTMDQAMQSEDHSTLDWRSNRRVAIYPTGLDTTIFRLFPNLETVHYFNQRPFRVKYDVRNLRYFKLEGPPIKVLTGQEAFDAMMEDYLYKSSDDNSHILNSVQESILYPPNEEDSRHLNAIMASGDLRGLMNAVFNKKVSGLAKKLERIPQIGLEPFIIADLKRHGYSHIQVHVIKEGIYEIEFYDSGKTKRIIYHQGVLSNKSDLSDFHGLMNGHLADLLFIKAANGTQEQYMSRFFPYIAKGGYFVTEPIKPSRKTYYQGFIDPGNIFDKLGGTDTSLGWLGYTGTLSVYKINKAMTAVEGTGKIKGNPAMLPRGGVDLSLAHNVLKIKNAGIAIKFHITPAMLAQFQNAPGLTIGRMTIQPLKSLSEFLGVNQAN